MRRIMIGMRKYTCLGLVGALWLISSAFLMASNDHVVQPSDLKQALEKNAELRKVNIQKLQALFKSEMGQKALKSTRLDAQRIEKAIPFLSDEELARLTAQAQTAESDFMAGALTNQQITYIIIALATAVVILVIVAA